VAATFAAIAALGAAGVASADPPVLRNGHMNLKQTWVADFDTGATGDTGDVWFEAVDWGHMDFRPKGQAQISSGMYTNAQGAAPFGYPFCAHANYAATPQPVTPAIAGAYFCVKTNAGHVAEFKVASISGDAAHHIPLVLHLSYRVWQ
jgi:hypothetical protein